MQYDDKEAYLENVAYNTRPLILHGNGLAKVPFNSLANYLGKMWNPSDGCIACKENTLNLGALPHEKLPRVTVAIFINYPTPFLEEALEKIYQQTYSRDLIDLFIHNSVSSENKILK